MYSNDMSTSIQSIYGRTLRKLVRRFTLLTVGEKSVIQWLVHNYIQRHVTIHHHHPSTSTWPVGHCFKLQLTIVVKCNQILKNHCNCFKKHEIRKCFHLGLFCSEDSLRTRGQFLACFKCIILFGEILIFCSLLRPSPVKSGNPKSMASWRHRLV